MSGQQHIRAVVAYLRGIGATDVVEAMGGKHPQLRFTWNGASRFYVLSGSPGIDEKGATNIACQGLRRLLGLTATARTVHARRHRRSHALRRPAGLPEQITAIPDWRDGLRAWRAAG